MSTPDQERAGQTAFDMRNHDSGLGNLSRAYLVLEGKLIAEKVAKEEVQGGVIATLIDACTRGEVSYMLKNSPARITIECDEGPSVRLAFEDDGSLEGAYVIDHEPSSDSVAVRMSNDHRARMEAQIAELHATVAEGQRLAVEVLRDTERVEVSRDLWKRASKAMKAERDAARAEAHDAMTDPAPYIEHGFSWEGKT